MVSNIVIPHYSFTRTVNGLKYCNVTLTIQFNISCLRIVELLNSCIRPICGTLLGTTTLELMDMKKYSTLPKASGLEPQD